MLANQGLLIEAMQAEHQLVGALTVLLGKVCARLSASDLASECKQLQGVIKKNDVNIRTLRDDSMAHFAQELADVKKYAGSVWASESREMMKVIMDLMAEVGRLRQRVRELEAQAGSDTDDGDILDAIASFDEEEGSLMQCSRERIHDYV